jgi:hypothetical protein
LSRITAYRIEKGDAGLAIAQVFRYLEAIPPGITPAELLTASDPALTALHARGWTKHVRDLSAAELGDLNFQNVARNDNTFAFSQQSNAIVTTT